jgi:tRNA(fMet)-specific endonuclease VapC
MNGRISLDTNIASRYLKNDPAVTKLLSNPSVIYLPVPVIAELLYGAENSARSSDNLKACNELIHLCEALNITRKTAVVYSKTKLALKKAGRPIPDNDLWIASVCIEHGMPLVTSDVPFSYVDGLVTIKA